MITTLNKIPLWIRIVSSLIALLGLFVGISLYVSPGTFIPDIDFSRPEASYLTQMWAARQIAIAGIIVFSLIKRSSAMLSVSLLAYCMMNLQDLIIGISKADYGLAGGASFFFVLPAVMMMVLYRRQKAVE
jgi:hypothetical protein